MYACMYVWACHLEIKIMFVRQKSNTMEIPSRRLGNGDNHWQRGGQEPQLECQMIYAQNIGTWSLVCVGEWLRGWQKGSDISKYFEIQKLQWKGSLIITDRLSFYFCVNTQQRLNHNKSNVWAFTQAFQKMVTLFLLPQTYLTSQSYPPPCQSSLIFYWPSLGYPTMI